VSEQNPSAPFESAGGAPTGDETVGQAPAKKKFSIVRIAVPIAIVVVLLAVGWWFQRDRVQDAKVGDCLPQSALTEKMTDASDTKTVECSSDKAVVKIVGIEHNKKSDGLENDVNTCKDFPTADQFLWLGEPGKAGDVFCLEPISK
jgi:hypothetical protein